MKYIHGIGTLLVISAMFANSAAGQAPVNSKTQDQTQKELRTVDAFRANDGTDNNFTKLDIRDLKTKGSAYLLRGWAPTDIQLAGNRSFKAVPAKYDVYQRELRVRRPQGDSIVLDNSSLLQFTMLENTPQGVHPRVFRRYPQLSDAKLSRYYFEVLHEKDGTQLLKLTQKTLEKGNRSVSYNGGSAADYFEDKVSYYAYTATNNSLRPVKLNTKALSEVNPGWQQALRQYGKPIHTDADAVTALQQAP